MAALEIGEIPSYSDVCAKRGTWEAAVHMRFGPKEFKINK